LTHHVRTGAGAPPGSAGSCMGKRRGGHEPVPLVHATCPDPENKKVCGRVPRQNLSAPERDATQAAADHSSAATALGIVTARLASPEAPCLIDLEKFHSLTDQTVG